MTRYWSALITVCLVVSVTIGAVPTSADHRDEPTPKEPQDIDNDGLYEDLDYTGELELNDVTVFYANLNTDIIQNNTAKYDFDGNGEITLNDVTVLFAEVQNKTA